MEKYKIVTKLDLEDFKQMEMIEYNYFLKENVTSAKETWKWYQKNPDTCIAIKTQKDKVIGSCTILPLRNQILEDIVQERIDEAQITQAQIEEYEEGKQYNWYLSAISIDPLYRNQISILKMLIKAGIELLQELQSKDIIIHKILAEACTIHGEKICTKLLKMQLIKETKEHTKFFMGNLNEMQEVLEKLKRGCI